MKANNILHSIRQAILICDRWGRVVYCNDAYEKFTGLAFEDMHGKPIRSLRKGTLVPKVIYSKEPIENVLRREGDQVYFASIYPILVEGKLEGTVSLITSLEEKTSLREQTGVSLKERVAEFERQQIAKELEIYGTSVAGKQKAAQVLGISLASLYAKQEKAGKQDAPASRHTCHE